MDALAMFDAFELGTTPERAKHLVAATLAALATMAVGLVALTGLGNAPVAPPKEKKVEVEFRPLPPRVDEPIKLEPAPPPPPPKPKPAATPQAKVPVAGPAAMVAPTQMPQAPAPESDQAVAAVDLAVGGTGDGHATAPKAPVEEYQAPVVAKAAQGPVNLPEEAEPCEPDENNPQPQYPESARATGLESRVVLKLVVEVSGKVGRVQVLKGDEPFISAALEAVKQWTYAPARLDGQPISVFKIVDLKFRLRE